MKKLLTITIVILLSITLLTGCGKKDDKKDEIKSNTNENVVKDQVIDELTLTNTSLITKNGESTLVTLVTNSTGSTKTVKTFDIFVKDEKGEVIVTLTGYVGGEVPPGESRTITSNVEMDLSKAKSVEYVIKK